MQKANHKNTYYFSHDCNARNDEKILVMRSIYGLEGYAMYFMIIEILREQADFKLKDTKYLPNALAVQLGTDVETVQKFLDDCCDEFNLFVRKDGFIYSESLNRRMGIVNEISKKRKEAASKRWENMQNECKCNANAYSLHTENEKTACKSDANALQNPKNGMQKNANKIKENKIKDIYNNNKQEKENKIKEKEIKEKEKKEKEKKEKSFSALSGNLDEGEKPPDELGQFLKDTVFKYTF